jgi:tRNA(His) guanylyltransferase
MHKFVPPEIIGKRLKERENIFREYVEPWKYIVLRYDGHCFSKFTKGFRKPFDINMTNAMRSTLSDVLNTYNPTVGYCQSDEITIIFSPLCTRNEYNTMNQKQRPLHMFNGRHDKLKTLIAGYISARFNYHIINNVNLNKTYYTEDFIDIVNQSRQHFDGRIILFDNDEVIEVLNYFVWRINDCYRNCVSAHARYIIPGKKTTHNKKLSEMIEMMNQIEIEDGVNFNYDDIDLSYKLGVFAKKELCTKTDVDRKTGKIVETVRSKVVVKIIDAKAQSKYEHLVTDKYWKTIE